MITLCDTETSANIVHERKFSGSVAPWSLLGTGGWLPCDGQASVVLPSGDALVMGGSRWADNLATIYKSSDSGLTWSQVIPTSTYWSARHSFSSVALPNGNVVVLGGFGPLNDVRCYWTVILTILNI